jgi:hypothetical protein
MDEPIRTLPHPSDRRRELRIRLTDFGTGRVFVDLRQFIDPPSDRGAPMGRVPTKRGLAFTVETLPDVIAALQLALMTARKAGMASSKPEKAGTSSRSRSRGSAGSSRQHALARAAQAPLDRR